MDNFLCPVCRARREVIFAGIVLNKYEVNYLFCAKCGLLQTEQPYWLEEAYGTAISSTDTGIVQRNLYNSKILSGLLYLLIDKRGKYLDIAGGFGILTRLMRDIGFDYYWTDKYCENLLARGFDLSSTKPPFTAISAFEVLEHIYEPLPFFRDSMSNFGTKTIIFSTEIFRGAPPRPDEWWYYSFDNGQHISFYQENTLRFIARELELNFYSHRNFHMMTNTPIKPLLFMVLTNNIAASLFFKFICSKMKSKTFSDHEALSRYYHRTR